MNKRKSKHTVSSTLLDEAAELWEEAFTPCSRKGPPFFSLQIMGRALPSSVSLSNSNGAMYPSNEN
jgi:hypothetical protein